MRCHKLLSITIFILLSFSVQIFAQTNDSLSANQFEGLEFDKKEAFVLCPVLEVAPFGLDHEEPVVEVTTKISGQPQNLKYQYSVSGGRIIGTGAKVSWNLDKMPPGLYKLTVNVRGENFLRKFVKEIQFKVLGHCSIPCSCPTLSVEGSSLKIGEGKPAVFTAQVRGGSQSEIRYKWSVSDGEIIKGQGTSKIKVETKGLSGKTITATVEVGGDICADCVRMESKTIEIN